MEKVLKTTPMCTLMVLLFFSVNSVYGQLTVDFTFSPDSACSGNSVSFNITEINGGSNNPEKYLIQWVFSDGGFSYVSNPVHIFEAFGCENELFTVTLTVSDTSYNPAWSGSKANTITVKPSPNPQIINELNNDTIFDNCGFASIDSADFRIEFKNVTQFNNCILFDSIDWEGDGTFDTVLPPYNTIATHWYHKLGGYFLTIKAEGVNGCTGISKFEVKNDLSYPSGGFGNIGGNINACAPVTYTFDLGDYYDQNSITTTYEFDFDDGSPIILWNQDSIIKHVGEISHEYLTSSCNKPSKRFNPMVTIKNSCQETSTDTQTGMVWIAPEAMVDTTEFLGCDGDSICFTSMSIPGFGNDCSEQKYHRWNFGNGNVSSAIIPECQFYPGPGVYYGWLIDSNYCGKDTAYFQVKIDSLVTASATPMDTIQKCVPFDISFSNSSTGGNLNFDWNISPTSGWNYLSGTQGNSPEPEIRFTDKGIYNGVFTATNACDAESLYFTVIAMDTPVITSLNLPPPPICAPDTIMINGVFDSSYSKINTWDWSFAGGIPPDSDQPPPIMVIYNSTGTFDVKVSIRNECEWSEEFEDSILLIDKPEIQGFIFENNQNIFIEAGDLVVLCESNEDSLFGARINGNIIIPTTAWSSSPSKITNDGRFTPDVPGIFNIQLIYGNTENCADTSSFVIEVIESPNVTVGDDVIICDGDTSLILLSGSPVGGDWGADTYLVPPNPPVDLNWYFNPSGISFGNYALTYKVIDPDTECEGSNTMHVIIDSKPDTDFSYWPPVTDTCIGVKFDFYSPPLNPAGTDYSWTINDGSPVPNPNITYPFNVAGQYEIKLKATSPYNACVDSTTKTINIIAEPPLPDFSLNPDTVCGSNPVEIIVLGSTYTLFNGNSEWFLDDDPTPFSNTINPSPNQISFNPGMYPERHTIRWELRNECGAKNISKTINVVPSPTSIIGVDSSNIYSQRITFSNDSENFSDCEWIVPEGPPIPGCYDYQIELQQGEEYTIKLVAFNFQNCSDTAEVTLKKTYKTLFIPNAFLPESTDPRINKFRAVGIGLLSYNLAVYDTWGNLIWQSSLIENGEPSEGWDGNSKDGKPYPQDVYIWYAHAIFIDNTIWQGQNGNTSGSVTLIR